MAHSQKFALSGDRGTSTNCLFPPAVVQEPQQRIRTLPLNSPPSRNSLHKRKTVRSETDSSQKTSIILTTLEIFNTSRDDMLTLAIDRQGLNFSLGPLIACLTRSAASRPSRWLLLQLLLAVLPWGMDCWVMRSFELGGACYTGSGPQVLQDSQKYRGAIKTLC